LAVIDPQGPWVRIARKVPSLLEKSTRNGFAMDWVSYRATDGFQPASRPGNPAEPGGSYDAIRVYLWTGLTNPETKGRAQTLEALQGMADYLAAHGLPPEQINGAGVTAAGNSPVGFAAALLPYLQAKGAKSLVSAQKARVMAQFDPTTNLFGKPPTYYDENLTLFGLGANQHVFSFGRDGELQVTWK
jgi:endo-1,4-beta-D-glucanase Y